MEKEQQYRCVFGHLDMNGDGKISPPELQICITKTGGNLSLEDAEMVAALIDSDGDGLLTFEDFVKVVESADDEEKLNDLKLAFNMYQDYSGCITPTSLRRTLSNLGDSRSLDDCKLMIAKFDINGDGVLTFDEFRNMMS